MCKLKYNGLELTLRQAVKQAKLIRESCRIGEALRGSNYYLLSELFRLHPSCGNQHPNLIKITVERGVAYKSKTFCAHFRDGSREYFGVSAIIATPEQRAIRSFRNAARTETLNHTRNFSRSTFTGGVTTVECAITGELIGRDDATVDHYPVGFQTLLDDWLKLNNLDWREIEIKKHRNLYLFASRKLAISWQDHHRQNAQLRITQSTANHKQGNPSRQTST